MIKKVIENIKPLDKTAMELCQLRLDNLAKPLGSLHALEHLAHKMAGITGQPKPGFPPKSIIIMAADHGFPLQNVTDEVTMTSKQLVQNCCQGEAIINVMAAHANADLVVVDIGLREDLPAELNLHRRKIAYGSKDMTIGPALTQHEVIKAIETGIEITQKQLAKGVQAIGLGEIAVGNTLASTAIIACYCPQRPLTSWLENNSEIKPAEWQTKIALIEKALQINQPNNQDPLDVLAKVGGLELAGLTGVILAAAAGRAVVVLDGVATAAAAIIATKLAPLAKEYLIGSHFAVEPAHKQGLKMLDIPAYLHLNIGAGEGVGAALGMQLLKAGLHVLNDMKTFGEASVAVAQDGPGAAKQHLDVL